MPNLTYNQMRTQHKAAGMQSKLVAPFTPLDIGELEMWLDGSEPTTFFTGTFANRLTSTTNPTTNLDPLCRWADKSNNGNHAFCAADATRPTYALSATLNGLTGCNLGTWSRPTLAAGAKTWFIVHKHSGTLADTRLCTNADNYVSLGFSASSSWNLSFVRDNVAWINSGFSTGTTARVYRVLFSGGNSTFWTASAGTETQRQTTALVGAAPIAGSLINLPGQLYEVLVYSSALSAPQIAAIHAYLTAKWGV